MSEKNRTSLCIKNEDAMLDMDIQYQFIPETLGSSIAIWLFLLLVFFLFRKNAFNFMRTELYLTLSVWLKGFEEKPEEDDPPNENLDPEIAVDEDKIEEETEDENENPPDPNPIADTATKRKIKIKKARKKELKRRKRNKKAGSGFISFMKNSFECLFYSDKTMMRLAGRDAVNYLGLQKYIIGFLLMLTIISLVIILPLNYQGIIYAGSGGELIVLEEFSGSGRLSDECLECSETEWKLMEIFVVTPQGRPVVARIVGDTLRFEEAGLTLLRCQPEDLRHQR